MSSGNWRKYKSGLKEQRLAWLRQQVEKYTPLSNIIFNNSILKKILWFGDYSLGGVCNPLAFPKLPIFPAQNHSLWTNMASPDKKKSPHFSFPSIVQDVNRYSNVHKSLDFPAGIASLDINSKFAILHKRKIFQNNKKYIFFQPALDLASYHRYYFNLLLDHDHKPFTRPFPSSHCASFILNLKEGLHFF